MHGCARKLKAVSSKNQKTEVGKAHFCSDVSADSKWDFEIITKREDESNEQRYI